MAYPWSTCHEPYSGLTVQPTWSQWHARRKDTARTPVIVTIWTIQAGVLQTRHSSGICPQSTQMVNQATRIVFLNHFDHLSRFISLGIDGMRQSVVRDKNLPHPRLVTRTVHQDFDRPSGDMTILLMSWGQFIDHDLALAMPPRCMPTINAN